MLWLSASFVYQVDMREFLALNLLFILSDEKSYHKKLEITLIVLVV